MVVVSSLRGLLTSLITGRADAGASLLLVEVVLTLGATLFRDWGGALPVFSRGVTLVLSRLSRLEPVAKRA